MPRRQIDLPEDTWRKLKAHAAIRGQTLSALFGDMAHDALSDRPSQPMREMTPHELEDEVKRLKRELAARPLTKGPELDRLIGYARQTGARGIPEVDAAIERGEKGTTTPFLEPAMRKARQAVIDEALGKISKGKK